MEGALYEYVCGHSVKETPELAGLRSETAGHILAKMEVSPDTGQLLHFLVKLTGASRIIEVGTFTGYSTLWMALALPGNGKIVTCETREEFAEIGKKYWQKAGAASKIELVLGDAVKTLEKRIDGGEAGTYDFAFIDADKENYVIYYEHCLALGRRGGLICIDNVLWNGRVIDKSFNNPNTVAIRKLNEKIYGDERVESCMVPIGDGLTLVMKR